MYTPATNQVSSSTELVPVYQSFYAYDGEGRLCAVQPTSGSGAFGYIYDAEGNRVPRGTITASPNPLATPLSCDPTSNGFTLTESYVLGPGGEELSMLDGANHWQRTNVYAAGKLVGTYDLVAGQPALHFQIADPLGSRRVQTDSIGWPEEQFTNWPFGDELVPWPAPNAPPSGGDDATPLHFTGKERDTESGNDYFGARYYASTMGRWLSPDYNDAGDDPEPVPFANFESPQSLNLYNYIGNNPLRRTDPTGHDCDPNGTMVNGTLTFHCWNSRPMDDGRADPGDDGLGLIAGWGVGKIFGMGIRAVSANIFRGGEAVVVESGTDALIGLNPAERKIAEELIAQGHNVSVIPRSGVKTADLLVDGVKTEIKTLQSAGTNTLKNAIQRATEQSDQNIIIDARNVNINAGDVNAQILRAQLNVGSLSGRVTVLTKDGTVKF